MTCKKWNECFNSSKNKELCSGGISLGCTHFIGEYHAIQLRILGKPLNMKGFTELWYEEQEGTLKENDKG